MTKCDRPCCTQPNLGAYRTPAPPLDPIVAPRAFDWLIPALLVVLCVLAVGMTFTAIDIADHASCGTAHSQVGFWMKSDRLLLRLPDGTDVQVSP